MSKIELVNHWLQISVNISILVSFSIGWHIYFRKRKKIKKNINLLKSKLSQAKAILPIEKSIDTLLSDTRKQDGSIIQMIITTKDGKVIDSSKESIDNYFIKERKVLEEKILELEALIDGIDIPSI